MRIAEIWRYPVKSLAGEPLESAELGPMGISGDRLFQVRRADGAIVDARAHPRLLALHPTLASDGALRVDGEPWDAPQVAKRIEDAAAVGPGAHLERREISERFDVLPLMVVTSSAVEALGYDRRRFRPNLVLGGTEGMEERGWGGHALEVGIARIGVLRLRPRCVMTTWDPDTQEQNPQVLRDLAEKWGGAFALDCWVIRGGTIRVGDPVALAPLHERPGDAMWGRYSRQSAREG